MMKLIITMQLEERLTEMGYSVSGMAASGEEAVEKARLARPDIVLMDIVMPGKLNGIEAAKIITEELDIPVVFVTAYADDSVVTSAKSVRPCGYIVKPFNESSSGQPSKVPCPGRLQSRGKNRNRT